MVTTLKNSLKTNTGNFELEKKNIMPSSRGDATLPEAMNTRLVIKQTSNHYHLQTSFKLKSTLLLVIEMPSL
jgi:hypothetical protein